MSAGAIFQEALRITNRQSLPPASQHAILAALEAGRPGPLVFLYEAGVEAGVVADREVQLAVAEEAGFDAIWASGFGISAVQAVPELVSAL